MADDAEYVDEEEEKASRPPVPRRRAVMPHTTTTRMAKLATRMAVTGATKANRLKLAAAAAAPTPDPLLSQQWSLVA